MEKEEAEEVIEQEAEEAAEEEAVKEEEVVVEDPEEEEDQEDNEKSHSHSKLNIIELQFCLIIAIIYNWQFYIIIWLFLKFIK